MSDINQICLTGRLTKDPELRSTPSGTSVASTAVAVEGYRKDAEEQPVSFIDLTIWGAFAELVAKKARKGDSVCVAGRVQQDRWEAEDGSKRSKVFVNVGSMTGDFMYRKADGSDTPAATEAQAEPVKASQSDDIPF